MPFKQALRQTEPPWIGCDSIYETFPIGCLIGGMMLRLHCVSQSVLIRNLSSVRQLEGCSRVLSSLGGNTECALAHEEVVCRVEDEEAQASYVLLRTGCFFEAISMENIDKLCCNSMSKPYWRCTVETLHRAGLRLP